MHVVVKNEDPNKGPLKLARYRGARPVVTSGPNVGPIPTYFDELRTEPCGVAVDVSERPMLFFVRDGTPVSVSFRLNNLDGHVTVKVRTLRRGLLVAGVMTYIFLVGIPMLIAAMPRVCGWRRGAPAPTSGSSGSDGPASESHRLPPRASAMRARVVGFTRSRTARGWP